MLIWIIAFIANWLPLILFVGLFIFWVWWMSRKQGGYNDLARQSIEAARENTATLRETNELLRAVLTKLDKQDLQ